MKEIPGKSDLVLEIDLSSESFKKTSVNRRDMLLYLGGKGLALKLLYDRLKPGIDTLGPDNLVREADC
jgi:aldehyde:ferredoxin oxidoreductase